MKKICKDCKHSHFPKTRLLSPMCTHSNATIRIPDYVYGGEDVMQTSCKAARAESGICGPDGKLWEEK